ncbi:MAG: 2-C-methyl-D-erythritol 4-phosphate cytidylyltransferase [Candidatus Competibacteraceae bacterium]|nr:MAG: 2-C-methyl-D-erythritol 4-phosphate cytidylyltransferase [Candidatus Competibacteraceae bacterium]
MGSAIPKQYLPLAGRSVIAHTLNIFLRHPRIAGLVVAVGAEDEWWPAMAADLAPAKPLWVTEGGAERCHSVLNGLEALRGHAHPSDWVLVHDAARPCLSDQDLDRLLDELANDPVGGLLAAPVRDTLKQADEAGRVATTVDRSRLWHALTPQMFRLELLHTSLRAALARDLLVTDEAAALEAAGFSPRLIEGRADNLKITRPEDLALAEFYLAKKQSAEDRGQDAEQSPAPYTPPASQPSNPGHPRIGHGFDVHAFGPGEFITLGGVRIPHARGLVAHSDGDVLLHALCDALLGAAGLGDIGRHFPDSNAEFKNIDSRILLRRVAALLREQHLTAGNVDATLVAQAPQMAPHIPAMREHIAADLRIEPGRVNLKATTTERLGYVGRGEGIAVHAVVMVF